MGRVYVVRPPIAIEIGSERGSRAGPTKEDGTCVSDSSPAFHHICRCRTLLRDRVEHHDEQIVIRSRLESAGLCSVIAKFMNSCWISLIVGTMHEGLA